MSSKKLPDTTLYQKEVTPGGKTKYKPFGHIMDNNLPYGDWLLRVRDHTKSTQPCRMDPEQYAALEAILNDLEDEISSRLVKEERAQAKTRGLSDHDRKVLEEAESKLSDDFLCQFQRKSISEAVHNALEVVKERYKELNNESSSQ